MKHARTYKNVTKRFFRPEIQYCLQCQTRLRPYATLSRRTIIRLDGVVCVTHRGYRCPNPSCPSGQRSYRSAAADALALPGFTFGLDIVVAVGQQRLASHQTLDEVHQYLQDRLAPLGVSISRREVMYLFDAYSTLLRAAQQSRNDPAWGTWLKQVKDNGGLIVSVDGIQPDDGNETIYLVRDVLTGRVLCAENLSVCDTAALKALLRPVVELQVPILGVISDAQRALVAALAELWPTVPHQLCHFHYLREASKPMYELDRKARTSMRKVIQPKVRDAKQRLAYHLHRSQEAQSSEQEEQQLQILADYALGVQTVLNLEGKAPFEYPGIQAYDALTEIEASLSELEKRGRE